MKFLNVLYYDILDLMRDKTSMLSMTLIPIVLMTTLGITLSSSFSSSYEFKPKPIVYINNFTSSTNHDEENAILDLFLKLCKENNIDFKESTSLNEGKKEVQVLGSILVEFKDDNIIIYKNSNNRYSTDIIVNILDTIAKKVSLSNDLHESINIKDQTFVTTSSFQGKRSFSSYDYYGIVEITMMILYGSVYGFYSIYNNRRSNIESRCFQGNLSKTSYILTKVLSSFIVTIVFLIPAILYSIMILKTYWGKDFLSVILLLLSLNFYGTTLGVLLGYIFKEERQGSFFLNSLIIPLMTFLGGGYFYIGDGDKLFNLVRYASPLTLINKSILSISFYEDYSKFYISILYCICLGFIFLISTFYISNSKEGY